MSQRWAECFNPFRIGQSSDMAQPPFGTPPKNMEEPLRIGTHLPLKPKRGKDRLAQSRRGRRERTNSVFLTQLKVDVSQSGCIAYSHFHLCALRDSARVKGHRGQTLVLCNSDQRVRVEHLGLAMRFLSHPRRPAMIRSYSL